MMGNGGVTTLYKFLTHTLTFVLVNLATQGVKCNSHHFLLMFMRTLYNNSYMSCKYLKTDYFFSTIAGILPIKYAPRAVIIISGSI